MSPAPHPRMHGLTHVQGGPDPIPGMPGGSPGSVTYGDYITTFSSLIGYWRLGETGSPWEDTNPNGYGPNDMVLSGSGTDLTPDVTGALPLGDDGALEFNHDGSTSTGGEFASVGALLFNTLDEITVMAFVKTEASAISRRGDILSNMLRTLTPADVGWALEVVYPARTVRFARDSTYTTSPGSLVADTWYHVAATNDGTTSKLYLNGVLVASEDDSGPSLGVGSESVRIGGGFNANPGSWLLGVVDEAAIFNTALTAGEIAGIYSAGSEEAGPAGSYVLISDGAGGSSWGKVTSDAIEDDTIVDADISPTAAVAVSKLVQGTDGQVLKTVAGVPTWAAGGAGTGDTAAWMPVTTVVAGVPELVWDGDDQLIPTLTTI